MAACWVNCTLRDREIVRPLGDTMEAEVMLTHELKHCYALQLKQKSLDLSH